MYVAFATSAADTAGAGAGARRGTVETVPMQFNLNHTAILVKKKVRWYGIMGMRNTWHTTDKSTRYSYDITLLLVL